MYVCIHRRLISLQVSNAATLSIGYMFFLSFCCILSSLNILDRSDILFVFYKFLMLQLFLVITYVFPFLSDVILA